MLIVGAGLSGIGAAWHLQDKCPGKSYAILEAREASGGTWDLFRYPGVRSDSDMYTLGYSFRPWKDAKAIADGPSILTYIREVASDHGIDGRIRYGHRVVAAAWSTPEARWTVEVERGPERSRRRSPAASCGCAAATTTTTAGYLPEFPGMERFKGRIVHPQKWTEDIDYAGKQRRGDRQRRHGGDAGAGDGRRRRRARHHAAALADLHGGAPQPGQARQ